MKTAHDVSRGGVFLSRLLQSEDFEHLAADLFLFGAAFAQRFVCRAHNHASHFLTQANLPCGVQIVAGPKVKAGDPFADFRDWAMLGGISKAPYLTPASNLALPGYYHRHGVLLQLLQELFQRHLRLAH